VNFLKRVGSKKITHNTNVEVEQNEFQDTFPDFSQIFNCLKTLNSACFFFKLFESKFQEFIVNSNQECFEYFESTKFKLKTGVTVHTNQSRAYCKNVKIIIRCKTIVYF
jgi:hypothetical protein